LIEGFAIVANKGASVKKFQFHLAMLVSMALASGSRAAAVSPETTDFVVVVASNDEARPDLVLTSQDVVTINSFAVQMVRMPWNQAVNISSVCVALKKRFKNARVVFAPSSEWELSNETEISTCERIHGRSIIFYTYEGFFKKKNTKRVIYLPSWPRYNTGVLISELVGTKRLDFIASGNEFRYWKSPDVPEDSAAMYENAASQGITVVPHRIDARTQEAEDQIAQIC
jgi:hypothetical protein